MRAFFLLSLASFTLLACASQPPSGRENLALSPAAAGAADGQGSGAGAASALSSVAQTARQTKASESSCHPLTMLDRLRLLRVANPENFPKTRYRQGSQRDVEVETDCSHFVNEIYRRAGFPYVFRATGELRAAPEFELLPEEEAMPGDLMLFRGHVGLVDNDGRIISSTRTHGGRRPTSITRFQRAVFKPIRGRMSVLRYRCRPSEEDLRKILEEEARDADAPKRAMRTTAAAPSPASQSPEANSDDAQAAETAPKAHKKKKHRRRRHPVVEAQSTHD